MDGYDKLRNAIIFKAVEDYRYALSVFKKQASGKKVSKTMMWNAEKMKNEVERFFRSQLFHELCDLDPETLIRKLKEEVGGKDGYSEVF